MPRIPAAPRNPATGFPVQTGMWVAILLTVLLGGTGIGLLASAVRAMRMDYYARTNRDRFFSRYFRFFWVLGSVVCGIALLKAAVAIWLNPLAAAGLMLFVPFFAIGLLVLARVLLPWIYDRRK